MNGVYPQRVSQYHARNKFWIFFENTLDRSHVSRRETVVSGGVDMQLSDEFQFRIFVEQLPEFSFRVVVITLIGRKALMRFGTGTDKVVHLGPFANEPHPGFDVALGDDAL